MKVKDRTNQIFGKLTAVRFIGEVKPNGGAVWECLCACGNTITASAFSLVVGHKKSCGCLIKDIGLNKRKEKSIAGFNRLYTSLKRRAYIKKLNFDITKDQLLLLSNQQCYYCNCPPRQSSKHSKSIGVSQNLIDHSEFIYNGLDRIDNSKGYCIDNVIACCGECNKLRSDRLSVKETEEVVKLLKQLRNTDNL